MPIWLRTFTYKQIEAHHKHQTQQQHGDDLESTTAKMKDMNKINPSQFKQFQFDKKKTPGSYSKK